MKARIDLMHVTPGVIQAMLGLERQVRQAGFDHGLLDLVRMRASQINGCAYCLDIHSKDARANGETEQRLYGLDAWRETPYYSARECAALEWTEALTLSPRLVSRTTCTSTCASSFRKVLSQSRDSLRAWARDRHTERHLRNRIQWLQSQASARARRNALPARCG